MERIPELRETKRTTYLEHRRTYKTEIEKAGDALSLLRAIGKWYTNSAIESSNNKQRRRTEGTARENHQHGKRMLLDSLTPNDTPDSTAGQRMKRQLRDDSPKTNDVPSFGKTEIRHTISGMRNRKAPSSDRIEVEAFKAAYPVIQGELKELFNACLRYGSFPEVWKKGSIRVLLKGSDRDIRIIGNRKMPGKSTGRKATAAISGLPICGRKSIWFPQGEVDNGCDTCNEGNGQRDSRQICSRRLISK